MFEKFAAGDKVFLIHLQEEAEVTRLNGAEMVYVKVDGMEIPVYCTDITKNIPVEKENVQPANREKKISGKDIPAVTKPPVKKSASGVFISFEPVKDQAGEIEKFKVGLLNDTSLALSFRYRFFLAGNIHFQLDKIVLPYQPFMLHEIDFDALNEMPSIDLHVRDVKNEIMKGDFDQKIKPQNFFNKLGTSALTSAEAYIYKVNTVSLEKNPVKREVKTIHQFDADLLKLMMMDAAPNKDSELSPGPGEIDLHIEALVSDHHSMNNSEMLHVQLAKFQQELDRAIGSGRHKFYAIHGIGTGKLKKEIHRILRHYKEVESFNNNYHPKYGYGATEILLR